LKNEFNDNYFTKQSIVFILLVIMVFFSLTCDCRSQETVPLEKAGPLITQDIITMMGGGFSIATLPDNWDPKNEAIRMVYQTEWERNNVGYEVKFLIPYIGFDSTGPRKLALILSQKKTQ